MFWAVKVKLRTSLQAGAQKWFEGWGSWCRVHTEFQTINLPRAKPCLINAKPNDLAAG